MTEPIMFKISDALNVSTILMKKIRDHMIKFHNCKTDDEIWREYHKDMLHGYKNRLLALEENHELKKYYESEIPKLERIIETTTHYHIEAIYEADEDTP